VNPLAPEPNLWLEAWAENINVGSLQCHPITLRALRMVSELSLVNKRVSR
jgi:hypothetical protein